MGGSTRIRARGIAVVTVAALGAFAAGAAIGATGPSGATGATGATGETGATWFRLVQYPAAGFGGLDAQITHARRSIDMEMYELADPVVERDLVAAAARGVRVRMLLDRDYSGGEVNTPADTYLSTHGVDVRWAPADVIFHIKATSVDDRVSDISSANLTARDYPSTRDAEVVDSDPTQVRAIEATFAADWRAGADGDPADTTVSAPGLIWSPATGARTAQAALVAVIHRARSSLDFESEELSDPAIIAALAADARRGVRCRVVMNADPEWDAAFATITRAGCRVRVSAATVSALYIHEKLILTDPGSAGESMFLGSQNASVTSLTRNRELGVVVGAGHGGDAVIRAAATAFAADAAAARPWSAAR